MSRKAIKIEESEDRKRAIFVDEVNYEAILGFLTQNYSHQKKFRHVVDLLLNHPDKLNRDIYERENIEKGCDNVYAIKLFKGKHNPRIYCRQLSLDDDTKLLVIVLCELLEKKKSQKLTEKEKNLIRKVASYDYEIEE